jgi:NADH-quinone oxidoreductase subunit C
VAEFDPLTISDEELKALAPADRAKVYKVRAAARAGGAVPGAAAAPGAGPSGSAPPAASQAAGAAASAQPTAPGAAAAPQAAVADAQGTSGDATPAVAATPATAQATGAAPGAEPTAPGAAPGAEPTAPAAKPAEPDKPAEPEKPAEPPFVQHILRGVDGSSWQWRHGYAEVKVPRERLLEAAHSLRADGFDYLSFVTEVDWQDRFELVYHLFSYDYRQQPLGVILRTDLPREDMPAVASLTTIWPGAEYLEREAFEMMGIRFLGHPDLRRILLPDDFVGFPMRRDFETDWDYITVKQLVRETD